MSSWKHALGGVAAAERATILALQGKHRRLGARAERRGGSQHEHKGEVDAEFLEHLGTTTTRRHDEGEVWEMMGARSGRGAAGPSLTLRVLFCGGRACRLNGGEVVPAAEEEREGGGEKEEGGGGFGDGSGRLVIGKW